MITGFAILDKVFWGNTTASYFLFFIYVILGLIFIKMVSALFNYVFKKLEEKIKKYDVLFQILRKPEPLLFIIFVNILTGASRVFKTTTTLSIIIDKLAFSLYVLLAAWFIIKIIITIIEKYLGKYTDENEDIKRYEYIRPLIKMLIKIFVFIIAILLIISNLGFNINMYNDEQEFYDLLIKYDNEFNDDIIMCKNNMLKNYLGYYQAYIESKKSSTAVAVL
jgi:small-conductance mechanosensitive channel